MYTDKVIFKGTPAQFYAVFEEFSMSMSDQSVFYINNTIPNVPSGRPDNLPIPNVVADTARVMIICFTEKEGIEFRLTAIGTFDGKTQITCWSKDEQEFEIVKPVWESFLGYAGNLGWVDDGYEKLPEPNAWMEYLASKGLSHGTVGWWNEVERMTERYWQEHGTRKLSITQLAELLLVGRDKIYKNTNLKRTETGK